MKIIITNRQYNMLVENITKNPAIDEGVGELIKSTLGRFSKKKSLSKNPIDVSVRNVFTKDLDADIMKRDKEFPNDKREADFDNTLLRIKAVYDKIRLSAYLEPNDQEHILVDDANWAIDTLIMYLYEVINKNLKSIYKPSRRKKIEKLINSMKRVKDTEIPVHQQPVQNTKPKSVPRGTSPKVTPPKPVTPKPPVKSTPVNPKPTPKQTTTPVQEPIKAGDMMWYNKRKVIVVIVNNDNQHSIVRYDGEDKIFVVKNNELVPI